MEAQYATREALEDSIGRELRYVEVSMVGPEYHGDGEYTVVGPPSSQPHEWYARVTVRDGMIARVR